MTLTQGVIMGIVQGLTEFLPVSSSGHLAAARHILHAGLAEDVGFEVAVHAGTLLAVLIFYRVRLWGIVSEAIKGEGSGRRWVLWLFIGTIPAGALGLTIKDHVAELFNDLPLVGAAWLLTAALLIIAERIPAGMVSAERLGIGRAFLIGLGQALALVPGVSRSGSTIAAGLMCRVEKRSAVDFAFILSLPAVGGALILTIPDYLDGSAGFSLAHLAGGITSAASGYLAIAIMVGVVTKGKLSWFALYCLVIGVLAIIFG